MPSIRSKQSATKYTVESNYGKRQFGRYLTASRFIRNIVLTVAIQIANQTLSQSVPPAVLITINGYTKVFIGTLVERAREIQEQWAAPEIPPDTPPTQIPVDPTDFHMDNPNNELFDISESNSSIRPAETTLSFDDRSAASAKPKDLGPLLPDHFREALRRYKRDGERGATGLTGVSVGLGLPGAGSARLEGRRLFR